MTLVGALGHDARAVVDQRGSARLEGEHWTLDWWVGADDRWRFPTREAAVRQSRVEEMPVVQTAVRIPNGDAIARHFGSGDGRLAFEVENASPGAFSLAFVIRGASSIALHETTVVVDGRPALRSRRAPGRWAIAPEMELADIVTRGGARQGPFPEVRDRRGRTSVAFLHPVAHRATISTVLGASDPEDLPDAEAIIRGWSAHLRRGMRVELPDVRLGELIDGARAQLLLAAGMRSDPEAMRALEDWGFDDEALVAWERLRLRDRRRARRRSLGSDLWPDAATLERDGGAVFLLEVRDVLGRESSGVVDLLRSVPPDWRGHGLEVHDLPVKAGKISYAVRWHGARPALLWEAPPGTTMRAPGLDSTWSTTESTGEMLLAG